MNLQAKEEKKLGLYVHVPFCASTCDFCAFYQEKPRREDLDDFIESILEEMRMVWPRERKVDTIFWGGGTPGLLMARDIERIGRGILEVVPNRVLSKRVSMADLGVGTMLESSLTTVSSGSVLRSAYKSAHINQFEKNSNEKIVEWTVEMAPSTVKRDKLEVMREMGVTRISMGVQTFNEGLLKELGRLHSPKQVYEAYDLIRECGFENVNLDLIFAIPRQSVEDMEADVREIRRLDPEHVSTYCLTFEEDTALFARLSRGELKIDHERDRMMYLKMWEFLKDAGYGQYEVSNFSKRGYECLHNVNTWKMNEWIGIGPSAASQYNFERYTNIHSLKEWMVGVKSGNFNRIDRESLTEESLIKDKLVFGLRMNDGVPEGLFREAGIEGFLGSLLEEGYVRVESGNVKLVEEGRLLVDRIGAEILNLKTNLYG